MRSLLIIAILFTPFISAQVSVKDVILLKSHGLEEEKILEAVQKQGIVEISAEDYFKLKQVGFSEEFLKRLLGQVTQPKFPEIPATLLRFYKRVAPQSRMAKVWALIIGVDNYRQTKFFPRLKYAVKDAESFARHLLSLGVPPNQICLLTERNVTSSKMDEMMEEILKSQGLVYFFYSGHGLSSSRSGFYFTCYDTDTRLLDTTAYSMSRLKKLANKMRSERLVLFLDACHSGAAKEANVEFYDDERIAVGPMNQEVESKVRELSQSSQQIAVITSCREDQVSREGTTNGLFTEFLLEGLSGKADRDSDGLVTTKEIFLFLNNLLPDKSNLSQMPDCKLSRSWSPDKGLPTPQKQTQVAASQQIVHILTPALLREEGAVLEIPASQWQLQIIGEIYGGSPVQRVLLDRREIHWDAQDHKFSGVAFLTPGVNQVQLAIQTTDGKWSLRTWQIKREEKPQSFASVEVNLLDEDRVARSEFYSGETITLEVSWQLPDANAEPVSKIDVSGEGIRPYHYDYEKNANAEVAKVNCPIELTGRNSGAFSIFVRIKIGEKIQEKQLSFHIIPHITLRKSVPEQAFLGQQLTYTIEVENLGDSDVEDVFLKEELTPGFAYVFSDISPLENGDDQVIWLLPRLAAQMKKTLTVTAAVKDDGRLSCTTRVRVKQRELTTRTASVDVSETLAKLKPSSSLHYAKEHMLRGHTAGINCVAFSPDGQMLASSGEDNTIQLWQLSTGKHLHTLQGHEMSVKSVCFSHDSRFLVSGSWDKTVRLWATNTGDQLRTIGEHEHPVSSVVFSPDGNSIASGSWDKTIKVWELKSGDLLQNFNGHLLWVNSVAFSPDGSLLASGGEDKSIKLWSLASGDEVRTLSGHVQPISSVCFSVTGRILAAASARDISLWSVSTGKFLQTLSGHTGWVTSVVFSPNGRMLASVGKDNTLTLWSLETRKPVQVLREQDKAVMTVAFSPDGQYLASGSEDQSVVVWKLREE